MRYDEFQKLGISGDWIKNTIDYFENLFIMSVKINQAERKRRKGDAN